MTPVRWVLITLVVLLSLALDYSRVAGAPVVVTPMDYDVIDLHIEERNWITKGLDNILGKTPFVYTTVNEKGEAVEKTVTRCPYTTQERVIFIAMIVVAFMIGIILLYLIAVLITAFYNALLKCYDRYVN